MLAYETCSRGLSNLKCTDRRIRGFRSDEARSESHMDRHRVSTTQGAMYASGVCCSRGVAPHVLRPRHNSKLAVGKRWNFRAVGSWPAEIRFHVDRSAVKTHRPFQVGFG